VSAAISMGEMDEAISAYRTLIDKHANRRVRGGHAARNAQYRLATHLASRGRATSLAMRAFDDFLGAYPGIQEAPAIRVLLARLCVEIGATRPCAEAAERGDRDDARDEDVRVAGAR
jgi:TolA-binding protein